jgi:uncharacterized protein YndB with AHSA1/START domain
MSSIAFERSIWIPSPRERVWQAVTDPAQLVKWFVPNLPEAEMKRDAEGKVAVYLYGMGVDFLTLEMTEPSRKAIMRSLPERLLTTTCTFEDQHDGTLVKVTLTGLNELLGEAGADRLQFIGKGWEDALGNLKAYTNGESLPFPRAFVGSLFGFWREPNKKLAIERSIWINAPREKVWRAIVDPKQLQQWSSPNTEWQLSTLEVGGRFYICNAETNAEMYVEVIEVLDPPRQLVTRAIPEPGDTVVKNKTYTLSEENGGTRLFLTLSGYEQEADGTRWGHMEENAFGFGMMLQNTKAYVEGDTLPFPQGF